MTNDHYHPTKLKPLVQIIAQLVKNNPSIADNPEYLMATIGANIHGFHDKSTCVNCGASMAEYIFEFDVLDALLLVHMAKKVKHRLDVMLPNHHDSDFTEANRIRVHELETSYAVKSRTTRASKLGLIAKLKSKSGKHTSGVWVITARGWEALRGLPVQKSVRVFRGQILERSEEKITIGEAFLSHTRKIEAQVRAGKYSKLDHRKDMGEYNSSEWVQIAGMHPGDVI